MTSVLVVAGYLLIAFMVMLFLWISGIAEGRDHPPVGAIGLLWPGLLPLALLCGLGLGLSLLAKQVAFALRGQSR